MTRKTFLVFNDISNMLPRLHNVRFPFSCFPSRYPSQYFPTQISHFQISQHAQTTQDQARSQQPKRMATRREKKGFVVMQSSRRGIDVPMLFPCPFLSLNLRRRLFFISIHIFKSKMFQPMHGIGISYPSLNVSPLTLSIPSNQISISYFLILPPGSLFLSHISSSCPKSIFAPFSPYAFYFPPHFPFNPRTPSFRSNNSSD